MPKDLPVTFTFNGKQYNGKLSEVNGGGQPMWNLTINNFSQGSLIKTSHGWQFSTQKQGIIKELGEYFGKEVERYKGKKL